MANAYPATFQGLTDWNKAMFEKLGFMVLMKSRNTPLSDAKVKNYVDGVDALVASIRMKISETRDQDCVADLKIMLSNAIVLQKHVKKDFGNKRNNKN
ncbi:hypothetical protein ATCVNEJV2_894R [Acanthocystis turfacea Chlorella virus NE-JV-2]|uniref:Uncharacterized protein Z743R n=1 Tax=Chlorovirus heliozoae TaxID=322019 RepID=A7KA03_9PHYC|nr:hypothetical protein ATCV1_Z743R [Acanthocystis turfacea chlorella virus 1]AGE49629.1 hypothetical protein ATCVCan0610SP_882R [Acanthocystis turfacea Chlorella virus Can0610SP]AGE56105.1 hypothetical protein ATCVMO0605SPH_829R [Acanthocystis turfacea Chlorella virus MO0605SPH]AGE56779.1 hypothetical protein ATCVNEJV2_894R [Acanthocystis turfacea Chlorella virus NE-JV-2]AGE60226.1 hypothetical protein ATCVWI0606_845R [Acanthocystis turfacea Chlorella virus WI0606]ABT16877.1 hypothetical prot